jgi:hypothetical protein
MTPARIKRLGGGLYAKVFFALGYRIRVNPGLLGQLPTPGVSATPNIPGGVMPASTLLCWLRPDLRALSLFVKRVIARIAASCACICSEYHNHGLLFRYPAFRERFRLAEMRQNLCGVEFDYAPLIILSGVNIHNARPTCEKLGKFGDV